MNLQAAYRNAPKWEPLVTQDFSEEIPLSWTPFNPWLNSGQTVDLVTLGKNKETISFVVKSTGPMISIRATVIYNFFPYQHRQDLWEDQSLERKFRELVAEWRSQIPSVSLIQKMVLLPAYQQIIGMGNRAVPLLLRELQQRPDHWFWALMAITGENPVARKDAGNLREMTKAWLDWGKKQGYLS